MKIKSLLLGSAVAMGLTTGAALAADPLGILSSLNVCDTEGISGLIIASETNCLRISGEVTFALETEFDIQDGNFDDGGYTAEAEWEITFDAVNSTDFGPAHAVVTITGIVEYYDSGEDVEFSEAYVSIGDTTIITAGLTDSISDDLTSEGLTEIFSNETSGLGSDGLEVGGVLVSLVHELGDGIAIGAALEALEDPDHDGRAFVGMVSMEQDMWSGHATFAYGDIFDLNDGDPDWEVNAGIGVEVDMFEFVAGIWFDENFSYEAVLSAAVELDMVTLAGEWFSTIDSPEYDDQTGNIFTGSATFGVNDMVEIAIAGVWNPDGIEGDLGDADEAGDDPHGEAGLLGELTWEASDTWEVVLHGEAWFDAFASTNVSGDLYLEGSVETTWNPDGDDNFEASGLIGVSNANGGEIFTELGLEKAFE